MDKVILASSVFSLSLGGSGGREEDNSKRVSLSISSVYNAGPGTCGMRDWTIIRALGFHLFDR